MRYKTEKDWYRNFKFYRQNLRLYNNDKNNNNSNNNRAKESSVNVRVC